MSDIKDFIIEEGKLKEYIGSDENVIIPEGVTHITFLTKFKNKVKSITFPNSIESFDGFNYLGDFHKTDIEAINLPNKPLPELSTFWLSETALYKDKTNWTSDGALYIGNHLICVVEYISGRYKIKPGTITIADGAFSSCKQLEEVTIPESVAYVSGESFGNCKNLKKINLTLCNLF